VTLDANEMVFGQGGRDAVVGRMRRLAQSHDGWVNISPVLPDGVEQPRPSVLRYLGMRGPDPLLATWMPGEATTDGGFGPTTVGLQHAAARRVVKGLAEAGLPVPAGWRVTQDHPSRGVVATVPADADPEEAVAWLLDAAERVTSLPLTGRWTATFYRRA